MQPTALQALLKMLSSPKWGWMMHLLHHVLHLGEEVSGAEPGKMILQNNKTSALGFNDQTARDVQAKVQWQ